MKKEIIRRVLIVVVIVVLTSVISSAISCEIDYLKNKVGQKIIFKNDTLMIIDYSMFNSNYTLENGIQISFNRAEKLDFVVVK